MHIRPASRFESGRLNEIAIEAKAHWGYTKAQMDRWRDSLLTTADSIENWPTIVAELNGQVVGYAQIDPRRHPWELVSLWVLPIHMGKGIGKTLLRHACLHASAAGQAALHIDADPNAEVFYRACGATLVGSIPAPIEGQPARVRPQLRLRTEVT